MMQVPSEKVLVHTLWTREKAESTPYVQWREGKPFIGDRRLILHG